MLQKYIVSRYFVASTALVIVLCLSFVINPTWEHRLYHLLLKPQLVSSQEGLMVVIDEPSLRLLGDLPFSQQILQKTLKKLESARLIVNTLVTANLENSQSLALLQTLIERYQSATPIPALKVDCLDPDSDVALLSLNPDGSYNQPPPSRADLDWEQLLTQTQRQLNHSQALARHLNKVVLAVHAQLNPLQPKRETPADVLWGFDNQPLSSQIHTQRLPNVISNFTAQNQVPRFVQAVRAPHPLFIKQALGIGWLPINTDIQAQTALDFPLVLQYQAYYYPSLALLVSILLNQQSLDDIFVTLGKQVQIKQRRLNTDQYLQARSSLAGVRLQQVSFADVYQGNIPAAVFQDKWVLLGMSPNLKQNMPSMAPAISLDELAKQIISLQQNKLIKTARSSHWLDWVLLGIYVFLFIRFVPLLKTWVVSLLIVLLSLLQIGAMTGVLWTQQQWWPLGLSIIFLYLAWGCYGLQQLFLYQQQQQQTDVNNSQDKRIMGLTYQSQGKLELAFAQLRQCQMDSRLLGLLYNLAMDFEQRKQSAQALAVYQYMQKYHPDYRDIEQRLLRLQHVLHDKNSQTLDRKVYDKQQLNTLLDSDSITRKPLLGHFQIEKRLGKGAMGVLYLGKDRKFNRMVALKTIALSDEFEGKELQEVTARFFREAEAASRLNHEYIISVYHAGEENKLAYIAMEFFRGSNLIPYTNPDNLLGLDELLEVIIKVAQALAYAHDQGVIHRDVKPGNIMYNQGTGSLKLTDFGIARITDQYKTRTGVILGTPSYMAPEQLAGNDLDGRADLFALGVMMYQLLTGQLPFKADSIASLMFQIAHAAPTNILKLRPQLPNCLRLLVNTLLEKQPERRYSTGHALVKALQSCKQQITDTQAEKA